MIGLLQNQRCWQLALVLALTGVTVLALMPQTEVPVSTSWDKADHLLAFSVLALLAERAFPRQSFWRWLAPALLIYGGALEVLQYFTPSRFAAWNDLVADALGIALYGLVRRWLPAWPGQAEAAPE